MWIGRRCTQFKYSQDKISFHHKSLEIKNNHGLPYLHFEEAIVSIFTIHLKFLKFKLFINIKFCKCYSCIIFTRNIFKILAICSV